MKIKNIFPLLAFALLIWLLYLATQRPLDYLFAKAGLFKAKVPTDTVFVTQSHDMFCLSKYSSAYPVCENGILPVRGQQPIFINETERIIVLSIWVDKAREKGFWSTTLNPDENFEPKDFSYANTNQGIYTVKVGFYDQRGRSNWTTLKIKQY